MVSKIQNNFFPHENKPNHFKELDGLRGIAVLLVLLSHSSIEDLLFFKFLNFGGAGKIGVYLFFVLSAYLLDRQIAIAFMSKKSSLPYWKNYFLRRFLRIFPLFIIALLVYSSLSKYGYDTKVEFGNLFEHMILQKGESVFWSIPVEFKYYILSPLIMWVFHRFFDWKINYIMITILILIVFSTIGQYFFKFSIISTFRFLPIFLIGTLISIYELLKKEALQEAFNYKLMNWIALVSILFIIGTIPYYFELLSGRKMVFHNPIFYLPFALIWGSLLLCSKYGKGLLNNVLKFKPLRFIGTISFSLYLIHMPVLLIIVGCEYIPQIFKIYLFFFIAILISSLSYLYIEKPLSKVRIYKESMSEKDIVNARVLEN